MTSGIYMITCPDNGHFYIGSSFNIERRWLRHKTELNTGIHVNSRLLRNWRKYKKLDFKIVQHVEPIRAELLRCEQTWLDSHKTSELCMNILPIAGSCLGVKRSAETKRKMSLVKTGLRHTSEAKEKMRVAKLGRKLTAEHRAKIGASNLGNKLTPRTEAQNNANALRQVKFTTMQVLGMKWLHSLGLASGEIGKVYGCAHTTAHRIVTGRRRAYQ